MSDELKEVVDVVEGQEPTPIVYGEQEEFEREIGKLMQESIERAMLGMDEDRTTTELLVKLVRAMGKPKKVGPPWLR